MGDGYWNSLQAALHQSATSLKRPRSEFDLPPATVHASHDMQNYLAQKDERVGSHAIKDTRSIGSAYDHYLQNSKLPSEDAHQYSGLGLHKAVDVGVSSLPVRDPFITGQPRPVGPDLEPSGRGVRFGGPVPVDPMVRPQEILPLPRDASDTLYVEGLPSNSTRREVAHIFRPFVGYREVRLVRKESKLRGRDPLVLCFVDFADPACAATALSALQGYKMDEHDPDSPYLRLQFSKSPGPKSASGPRRRR